VRNERVVRFDQQLERPAMSSALRVGGTGLGPRAVEHQDVDRSQFRHCLFDGGCHAFGGGQVRFDADGTLSGED
jgi:hypothetical protein